MDTISIVDWFDPGNVEHIKGLKFLEKHCYWPSNFITAAVSYPPHWQMAIYAKIARHHIDEITTEEN